MSKAEPNVGASRNPALSTNGVAISQLHPTQMTVGYAEVLLKRQQWRTLHKSAKSTFIAQNPMPSVLGPKGRHFIVDHHHLARALLEEDVAMVQVTVLADLSALAKGEFWIVMNYRQWVHPYDSKGRRHPCGDLPKKVPGLRNDSYRSLAAAVRMAGGVPKEQTPFAEFLWADFFRRRISAKLLAKDPAAALAEALQMVHNKSAEHLPGWTPAIAAQGQSLVFFTSAIERRRSTMTRPPIPMCLDGRNACPPEDVGGVGGYMEFLEAIADPTHDEHIAMWQWGGGPFDPTGFDRNAVNAALRKLRL